MAKGWTGFITGAASGALTTVMMACVPADTLAASGVHRLALISGHGDNYVLAKVAQKASVSGPRITVFA